MVLRFGLKYVEDVAGNQENGDVIAVLNEFRRCLNDSGPTTEAEVKGLAVTISKLAASHPGSRSIDGTRHTAVSATYALARAVNGNAIDALRVLLIRASTDMVDMQCQTRSLRGSASPATAVSASIDGTDSRIEALN